MIQTLSQTATFYDLYQKVNEIITFINTLETNQGTLSELNTINKNSLVSAINEKNPSLVSHFITEE